MKITEHVSYSEIVYSYKAKKLGIKNIPDSKQLSNITSLCENIFEPVRLNFKVPIYISSCFRSKALNIEVNGSTNSQHLADNGAAMDLDADRYGHITNADIFNYIKNNLDFDQLIWEYGTDENPDWVHVSYKEASNRKSVLKAYKDDNNDTRYIAYKE